ncbi:MAG: cytochrome c oxidase subunit II [Acidimicrobiia bacterium]
MTRRRRLLVLLVLLVGVSLLASCSGPDRTELHEVVDISMPQNSLEPAGPEARRIDGLWQLVFWIAVGVFVLVQGALLFALFRFRERKGERRPIKQLHGNTKLEIGWTLVPAMILAVIAVPTVSTIFEMRSPPGEEENVLHIEVTGHQWWWEFHYPEYGLTTAGEMHIPAGRPVWLTMTSADVIHSFWVPTLNGKRDVVPGRMSYLRIEADEPGVYLGQCAEFCGLAHADMRQRVFAHTEADFEAWAAAQAQPADLPTEGPALAGWETFKIVCASCHAIDGTEVVAELAPNLTHFASRTSFGGASISNTREHLRQWLRNPSSLKPMTPERNDVSSGRILGMPSLGLTEQQIDELIAFLEGLE